MPRADRHQNEYVPASEERLAWLTGFTGSAGFLIVLPDKAVLFTDGRYTLQAREQTDPAIFTLVNSVETPPSSWIEQNLTAGHPDRLRSLAAHRRRLSSGWPRPARRPGWELVPVADNPVDEIWTDRPAPPLGADHAA